MKISLVLLAFLLLAPSAAVPAPAIPPELVAHFESLTVSEKLALAEQYGFSVEDLEGLASSASQRQGSDESRAVTLTQTERISRAEKNEKSTTLDGNGELPALPERVDQASAESLVETQADAIADKEVKASDASVSEPWDKLSRFGAEMFDQSVASFEVANNWPVSEHYLVGVGDEIEVQLIGKETSKFQFTVGRDGNIVFPRIGEMNLAGMSFPEVKSLLSESVEKAFIGTKAVTSLGSLRKINVFAAGSVTAPGNYAVLNSTTLTQLLFIVGGPGPLGSFRDIQVHREGKMITSVDLYDLLLNGSLTQDLRLQNGDVLFVPSAGPLIGVQGRVRRPAKYEVRDEETLQSVIDMAQGLLPDALMTSATLHRRDPQAELPTLINIDLRDDKALNIPVLDGDFLTVAKLPGRYGNPITLTGAVEHPGLSAWFAGVRVSDLVPQIEGRLKENADVSIGLILRRRADRQSIDVLSFSPRLAIAQPGSEADPVLLPHDEIIVFDRSKPRSKVLEGVIEKLRIQSTIEERPKFVEIRGAVSDPGKFPLLSNQTVSGLIELAGGSTYLDLNVDMDIAVIVRRDAEVINKFEAIPFRLGAALNTPNSEDDPLLQPMDELLVLSDAQGDQASNRREILQSVIERFERQASLSEKAQVVQVLGEVREPGTYPILNTLSIDHLIELAGGYTEAAYTKAAEIHRVQETGGEAVATQVMDISLQSDVIYTEILQSRDVLRINKMPGWQKTRLATVTGEVSFPGSFALTPGERLSDLVRRAGGITELGSPDAAKFTSEQSREEQQKQSSHYFTSLRKITLIWNSGQKDDDDIAVLEETVEGQLDGRIVVDLPGILSGESVVDPVLRDGDALHVPPKSYQVAVVGEVYLPGDFSYVEKFDVRDYIEQAGGLTQFSEPRRAYIIKANGAVVVLGRRGLIKNRWRSANVAPGDTIVVPVDLTYESAIKRIGSYSRVAFETLGSLAALLNISKL